jgi:hypothetical protein
MLELNVVMSAQSTIYDAAEVFHENPDRFGLIMIDFRSIIDVEIAMKSLFPPGKTYRARDYSIVMYEVPLDNDEIMDTLERCGVSEVMQEPYTLKTIKVTSTTIYFSFDVFFMF